MPDSDPDSTYELRLVYSQSEEILGIAQDITERVQAQSKIAAQQQLLLNASKLSALGEMAGGIAHEINNPIAVVMLHCEAISGKLDKEGFSREEIKKDIQRVSSTAERIAKIVSGLKFIARDATDDPFEIIKVRNLVNETIELCIERFRSQGIELKVEVPNGSAEIQCRGVQISQVLLNLLNNAFDAVTEAANLEPKKPLKVQLEVADLGPLLEFRVLDSGLGVPEEIRDKIFQPFFTTKESGKGTGLGLSLSRRIIERHGGTLTVEARGDMTCFIVSLPKNQNPTELASR
jgi:C4-dicarboxylate-specific signal transduction histidine kinase